MIKLGRISTRTKGPVVIGFAEDIARTIPGNKYPLHQS